MKIFVLRHGETNENITKILQGNMDTILNEEGKKQAILVGEKIKEYNINLIISSPRKRALETAQLACPNIPIIIDDRLKSRNHGIFQGKSRDEINLNDYWNIKKNIEHEKTESVMDVYNRVDMFLKEIKEKYKDKRILIVTHSGICRILYYYFGDIPDDGDLLDYESHNCSFEEYEL